MSSTISDNLQRNSSSGSSSFADKYHGMIERSLYKKFRNLIFALFAYIYSISPNFYPLHEFIEMWRIYYSACPMISSSRLTFWKEGTLSAKIVDFLSIPTYFCPVKYRLKIALPVLLIHIIIFTIFWLIIIGSGIYYKRNAQLPFNLPSVIVVFVSTLGYIQMYFTADYLGEFYGAVFSGYKDFKLANAIIITIFTLLNFVLYSWLFTKVTSISITFRANSFSTVYPFPQVSIFVCQTLVTFASAFASRSFSVLRYIFSIVSVLLMWSQIYFSQAQGGLLKRGPLYISVTCVGGFFLLATMLMEIFGVYGNEIALSAIVAGIFFGYIVSSFYTERQAIKRLNQLDAIQEDPEIFDQIKTQQEYMAILQIGFQNAHPYCLSWDLCTLACRRWPNSILVWFSYAKFIAIYPEEAQTLTIILQKIIQNKIKGSFSKQVQAQIFTIILLRESNLSVALKEKLSLISKSTTQVKHKLRHIWDMVIQGNLIELERAISGTYSAVNKCEAEYLHVVGQYPNNRFVTRSYARFLLDIKADLKGYEKCDADMKLLQRGVNANEDQAHLLGMATFPLLPSAARETTSDLRNTLLTTNEDLSTAEALLNDNDFHNNVEQAINISNQINSLVIPSFRSVFLIHLIFSIFFIIIIVFLIIYSYYKCTDLSRPLDFLHNLSEIRAHIFHIVLFSISYIMESDSTCNYSTCNDLNILPNANEFQYLGRSINSKDQLLYSKDQLLLLLPNIKKLQTFSVGFMNMTKVREASEAIFNEQITIKTFPSNTATVKTRTTTCYGAIAQYLSDASKVIDLVNPTKNDLKNQIITNQIANLNVIVEKIESALDKLAEFVNLNDKDHSLSSTLLLGCLCGGVSLIYLIAVLFAIHYMNKEKMDIYKCLTGIPKNVVSSVADKLKILKKQQGETSSTNESEVTKQEENMLKIFASGDSYSHDTSLGFINIMGTIIYIIIWFIAALLFVNHSNKTSKQIYYSTVHINYILGTYSYHVGILQLLLIHSGNTNDCSVATLHNPPTSEEIAEAYDSFIAYHKKILLYFNRIRYGNFSLNIFPFSTFTKHMDENIAYSCNQTLQEIKNTPSIIFKCYTPELILEFINIWEAQKFVPYYQNNESFTPDDPVFTNTYIGIIYYLYNNFFAPLFSTILQEMIKDVSKILSAPTYISVVVIFVVIDITIYLLYVNVDGINKLKFTLRLLLHCPSYATLQNNRIMEILHGNISGRKTHETTNGGDNYFIEILNNMPDVIILLNAEGKIIRMNKSAIRTLGLEDKNYEGEKLRNLFNPDENQEFYYALFSVNNHELNKDKTQDEIKEIQNGNENATNETIHDCIYSRSDDTVLNFRILVFKVKSDTIITIRDRTQEVRYNTLIQEEGQRSERFLSTILPPKLVHRVRDGEKDISFAVQSATVCFIDIVEFTPWCASLQADEVMKTLNELYTRFDNRLSTLPSLTRVKCIGDCYMAAGGIFMEVNQAEVHAKEMVEFGLGAIEGLKLMNQEQGRELKIRVGINTGGPIVAGVLGIGKPTFEIIGPTISMAQQMEHNGVAMQVHISRPVYELIYGGPFEIKERGEIEIKNGKALTYLVTRKFNQ